MAVRLPALSTAAGGQTDRDSQWWYPLAPIAPWLACRQISLPLAASIATMALPVACTNITPSTTIGLNVIVPSNRVGQSDLEPGYVRLVDLIERRILRGGNRLISGPRRV